MIGLGTDIVVNRFSEEKMTGVRQMPELAEAEVSPMTLSDIFITLQASGDDQHRGVTR